MRFKARFIWLCVFLALLTCRQTDWSQSSQPVDFGVLVGKPAQPAVEIAYSQYIGLAGLRDQLETPNLVIGPSIEFTLNKYLGIELDALRKSVQYRNTFNNTSQTGTETLHGSWWEFPIMGKVRLSQGNVHPFALGGFSFYRTSLHDDYTYTELAGPNVGKMTSISNSLMLNGKNGGLVIGGGLVIPASHFRIEPQLRYTRWSSYQPGPAWYDNPNQFDFLLGFAFRP